MHQSSWASQTTFRSFQGKGITIRGRTAIHIKESTAIKKRLGSRGIRNTIFSPMAVPRTCTKYSNNEWIPLFVKGKGTSYNPSTSSKPEAHYSCEPWYQINPCILRNITRHPNAKTVDYSRWCRRLIHPPKLSCHLRDILKRWHKTYHGQVQCDDGHLTKGPKQSAHSRRQLFPTELQNISAKSRSRLSTKHYLPWQGNYRILHGQIIHKLCQNLPNYALKLQAPWWKHNCCRTDRSRRRKSGNLQKVSMASEQGPHARIQSKSLPHFNL